MSSSSWTCSSSALALHSTRPLHTTRLALRALDCDRAVPSKFKVQQNPLTNHAQQMAQADDGFAASGMDVNALAPSLEDVIFEEELMRSPYSLRLWIRYLDCRKTAPPKQRNMLFERALRALPGCYKLWLMYLQERTARTKTKRPGDPAYEALNNTFERALVFMHKMPRIWLLFGEFLMLQKLVTRTRKTLDHALQAIPVTQHNKLWKTFLKFADTSGVPETACRIYRRHLKLEPDFCESFIDFLVKHERWDEAATLLADALNRSDFQSKKGKSKHDLWLSLCDMLSKHAPDIKTLKVEPILRGAMERYKDETGMLWNALADYFARLGLFERARDVYEEAVHSVLTVKDFAYVFDAYAKFEDTMIQHRIEEELPTDELDPYGDDLELRLARMERLLDRRPELVSLVLLRQNPNNVAEWHNRVHLFEHDPAKQAHVYAEAVQTVDPQISDGNPYTLWVEFAKFYAAAGDLDSAKEIFERAVQVNFKKVDDLAKVWCEYVEMLVKTEDFDGAMELARRSVSVIPKRQGAAQLIDYTDGSLTAQQRLFKSSRLWSLLADLEESLGTLGSAKSVYERIIELKVATPTMLLNYANMLEENNYFEDSFRVYEKGVALFRFPVSLDLWRAYLTKFIKRYAGTKIERTRDLFQQLLETVTTEHALEFYNMYIDYETAHGLTRNAIAIFEQALKAVAEKDRVTVYNSYISHVTQYFGVTQTRPIYESAVASLPDIAAKGMCLRYAELERKLGEIDRARALYQHASQFSDPRSDTDFWEKWQEFEVQHGNEETYKEMRRLKRSVQLQFTQMQLMQTNIDLGSSAAPTFVAAGDIQGGAGTFHGETIPASDVIAALESQGAESIAVPVSKKPKTAAAAVPDANEIVLDDLGIVEMAVPDAVFGGLKGGPSKVGALDRFKK